MITPGALLQRVRQRFGYGLRTAYYRDIVRPRILKTQPVAGLDDFTCEAHVMTSAGDWLNLIWTLKSFYHYSKRRYALCIHDDGTVPVEGLEQLRRHFPDARLIPRAEADGKVFAELAGYPRCLEFRRTNLLSPKVFDFRIYLKSPRMLLLDSDLLFFREPVALLERIENKEYKLNTFNADCGFGYAVKPDVVRAHLGLELRERINSGLGVVQADSMRWDWVEEFLAIPGIVDGHFWRIEQTLFALCASRYGVEMLPEQDYSLYLEEGIGHRPFRHYVGKIRHLMYKEGMAHLVREGFLQGVH